MSVPYAPCTPKVILYFGVGAGGVDAGFGFFAEAGHAVKSSAESATVMSAAPIVLSWRAPCVLKYLFSSENLLVLIDN